MWVRISRFGKIANIPEVLFLRRVHDENKCLRGMTEVEKVSNSIIKSQLNIFGKSFTTGKLSRIDYIRMLFLNMIKSYYPGVAFLKLILKKICF